MPITERQLNLLKYYSQDSHPYRRRLAQMKLREMLDEISAKHRHSAAYLAGVALKPEDK